ncbi:MAG: glutamine synthetase, partial [Ilumatobacteraceae bacterium]
MLEQQRDYVLHTVEERGVRLIRLWFTDVLGSLKSFAISPAELENALEDGMTFDGSSIDGFGRTLESDVLAMPDANTFEVLPWGDDTKGNRATEARVFCDIHNLDGTAFEGDPRQVLRRNLQTAHERGYTFFVAPDIEFFYFSPPEKGQAPVPLDEGGFFDLTTTDVAGTLRKQTIRTLETMSIPVEYSFHEDAPSQHEIDLRHTDALTMADSIMTFRLVVKEVAASQGVHATFMPKPLESVQGSGMHVHLSLFDGDENAFFSADDSYNLSPVAKQFMAGLLRHAAEITAITNQTVNSYKRLVPGFEAPVHVTWARN